MAFHNDNDPLVARRALAHALGDYLDRHRVHDALTLWSRSFEGRDSLVVSLNRYCRQVAQAFGLAGKEAELHLKVFRALQSDPRLLPDDPLTQPPRARTEAPSAGSTQPPANGSAAVMRRFYLALEEQLARDLPPGITPARVRRTLIRHAAALPRAQQHAASLWWSDQVSSLGGEWPAGGAGTALVNVMYVSLAELAGPVRADQCFTEAVRKLEASDDPALAEIRRFL